MEDTKKQSLQEGIEAIKQEIKQSTSELQTKKQAKAPQAELEPLLNKLKDLKAQLTTKVPTLPRDSQMVLHLWGGGDLRHNL
jgi:chromosome segregation ATPase